MFPSILTTMKRSLESAMEKLTFTISCAALCKQFLQIKWRDKDYMYLEELIQRYPDFRDEDLEDCCLKYRGTEKSYTQWSEELVAFSETMPLLHLTPPIFIIEPAINVAAYFVKKASECLQVARLFTVKSAITLASNRDLAWAGTYLSQYYYRCLYFGTASTWYSNCFDQILQVYYWGLKLYTSAKNKKNQTYCDSWGVEKTLGFCTYNFVSNELGKRNYDDAENNIKRCYNAIQEVRTWANFIKHKGGLDYQYLEPQLPMRAFFLPNPNNKETGISTASQMLELKNFRSPIQIDIDEKMNVLKETYVSLYTCLQETIRFFQFDHYSI